MEVRNHKLNQFIAALSDAVLKGLFQEIMSFRDSGILDRGAHLRVVTANVCTLFPGSEPAVLLRTVEDAVLLEMSRRYFNTLEAPSVTELHSGMDIWYVDTMVEHGVVFGTVFENGVLRSFSVTFDNGDFDEFNGTALGTCFFLSEAEACAKVGTVNN